MTLRPNRMAEWNRWVKKVQSDSRYRIVRSKMNPKRRNPADDADHMYEAFHGRPSEELVIVEKQFYEPSKTAACGDLVECWVETPTGLLACVHFPDEDRPFLTANTEGNQLYIEGGD